MPSETANKPIVGARGQYHPGAGTVPARAGGDKTAVVVVRSPSVMLGTGQTVKQPSNAVGGGDGPRSRPAFGVVGVVFLALIVRLVHVYQTGDVPFVRQLVGDAAGYFAWAERIAGGAWIGSEPFYQAPLYPYCLAALFSAGGSDVWLVRVVQGVVGAGGVGLLAVAATNWFGRRAGVLAGVMLALYPPAVFYDGLIQKAALSGFLTCALLCSLSGVALKSRPARFLLLGVVAGLLALTRENALVWIPLLAVGIVVPPNGIGRRVGLVRVSTYLAGVALVLAPVAARNFALGGGLSPSTAQAGPNFYIGNHTGADGRYQPLVRGHETPAFERADATRLAERATGHALTASEVSRYWMSRAWRDVRSDPRAWTRLMGRKLLMVVNDYEVADAEGMAVYADASGFLAGFGPVWRFGVLCPLGVMGIFLTRASWRRVWSLWGMIAAMIVAVAVFFVLGRYRVPLVPLLILFAAGALVRGVACVRMRRWFDGGSAVLVGLIVAVASNWPVHDVRRLDALARMNAGVALAEQGNLEDATAYFETAVAGYPESPEANVNLAQALARRGEDTGAARDFERAVEHYRRAAAVEPGLPGLFYNLGVALERIGRNGAAVTAYERAVAEHPDDVDARRAVERLRRH